MYSLMRTHTHNFPDFESHLKCEPSNKKRVPLLTNKHEEILIH